MNAQNKRQEKPQDGGAAAFRQQLEQRLGSFAEALPPHITPERFKSVVAWAVMADPNLLVADRISLFEACLAAANDGLLPDKKEGALVVYNTKLPKQNKSEPDVWIKKVQWLPMVRGIITKIYNTGKVKSVSLDLVYGGDHWRYWKDDKGEHFEHEPAENRDKSLFRRAYAAVVMKESEGGGAFCEPLDADEIEKVRSKSKSRDSGPWVDWWDEMAKKTAMKRLAKRLPIAREIEQVLARDNFLYDLEQQRQIEARQPVRSLTARLDDLASGGVPMTTRLAEREAVDNDTGEIVDQKPVSQKQQTKKSEPSPSGSDGGKSSPRDKAADQPSSGSKGPRESDDGDPVAKARAEGAEARAKGMSRKAVPAQYRQDENLMAAYLDGFDTGIAEDRDPGAVEEE